MSRMVQVPFTWDQLFKSLVQLKQAYHIRYVILGSQKEHRYKELFLLFALQYFFYASLHENVK